MANGTTAYGGREHGPFNDAEVIGRDIVSDASKSNAVFCGDPITREADGNAIRSAAGQAILGWATWTKTGATRDQEIPVKYLPAATLGRVGYMPALQVYVKMRTDVDGAGVEVGKFYDLNVTAGNTDNGVSGVTLDTSSESSTEGQVIVHKLVQSPDNEQGAAYQEVIVRVNPAEAQVE